jgi:hypothetical protein
MFSLGVADLDGGLSRIMAVFPGNVDGYARAVEWGEGVAASSARRVRTERGEPTDPVVKRASCDQRGAARLRADFASLSHK